MPIVPPLILFFQLLFFLPFTGLSSLPFFPIRSVLFSLVKVIVSLHGFIFPVCHFLEPFPSDRDYQINCSEHFLGAFPFSTQLAGLQDILGRFLLQRVDLSFAAPLIPPFGMSAQPILRLFLRYFDDRRPPPLFFRPPPAAPSIPSFPISIFYSPPFFLSLLLLSVFLLQTICVRPNPFFHGSPI